MCGSVSLHRRGVRCQRRCRCWPSGLVAIEPTTRCSGAWHREPDRARGRVSARGSVNTCDVPISLLVASSGVELRSCDHGRQSELSQPSQPSREVRAFLFHSAQTDFLGDDRPMAQLAAQVGMRRVAHWDTPLAGYGDRPSERVGPCLGRPGAAARVKQVATGCLIAPVVSAAGRCRSSNRASPAPRVRLRRAPRCRAGASGSPGSAPRRSNPRPGSRSTPAA